jgi:copper oxidase (laccase) domain-containing protein
MSMEVGVGCRSADASVTTRPGRVLAIMTADCLPVLLASKVMAKLLGQLMLGGEVWLLA